LKTDLGPDGFLARAGVGIVLALAAVFCFLVAGLLGGLAGAALGVGVVVVLEARSRKKRARRRAVLEAPFPESARDFLLGSYDHYERLPPDWRRRFEDDVRIFLAEKRITGIAVEVTDELRLLVAASAVTISLGWPDYEWDQLTEVLLYPQDFDRDYRFDTSELAGQAHPWGTIILSVPSLQESFEDPDDGFHVGIHEFAHLLDGSHSRFDGIPPGLDASRSRDWRDVADREM
jgi:Mlc titration factor MtfA (ptsG expression regulator)